MVGLRPGDRAPDRVPVLPHGGTQVGRARERAAGGDDVPAARVRRAGRAAPRRAGADHGAARPADPCSRRSSTTPTSRRFDLSSIRSSPTGAAVVPVEVVRQMREILQIDMVVTGYGMTETHGTISMCRFDDPPEVIATTVGKPLPGVEVRVVDDEGVDVPAGDARRADRARLQRDAGLLRRSGRDRRRRSATAGCPPATSGSSTPTATSPSPTARRTCSSSAASTPTRRRSRRRCSVIPTSRRSPSSACPTSGWARSAWRSSYPVLAPRPTPTPVAVGARTARQVQAPRRPYHRRAAGHPVGQGAEVRRCATGSPAAERRRRMRCITSGRSGSPVEAHDLTVEVGVGDQVGGERERTPPAGRSAAGTAPSTRAPRGSRAGRAARARSASCRGRSC